MEQYLRECLDSVVNQTLREIEIICVDDGSTDSSLDILKEYAAKDKRVTVIKQENLHAGVARNAGLAVAKGEYIHFLDSDDWIDLDTYQQLYNLIQEKQADFVKFKSYTYDNEERKIVSSYFTNMSAVNDNHFGRFNDWKTEYQTLVNVSDAPWSGIYNRDFLISNHILFDNLLCANDTSFFYRCLVSAKKIYLEQRRFVYYRINNSASLINIRAYNFDCQIKQFFIIQNIVKDVPDKIKEVFRKHLISALFYRYSQYKNNTELAPKAKREIYRQIKRFIYYVSEIEIPAKYLPYYYEILERPLISVIIPVYNAENYLHECLNSVVNQTLREIEIICVDDGSSDSSLKILQKYKDIDSRIKIISQKNKGSASARNNGMKNALGCYIGFIDSDDVVSANYFEALLNCALSKRADIAATSNVQLFNTHGFQSLKNMGFQGKKIIESVEDKGNIIITTGVSCNKIYRKGFLDTADIKCLEIKNAAEDNYFTDTAIIASNKITVVDNAIYYYRINQTSQTQVLKNRTQFLMTKIYQMIDNYIINQHLTQTEKDQWLEIINKRKVKDFIYFKNTMQSIYIKDFRKHFISVFPNLKKYVAEIIVSLTSYPARIKTVHQTIYSLLTQSVKADKVILWLAEEQFPNKEKDLPQELLSLTKIGLEIDWYHDIKSYKKLIPSLKKYPDAIIVTADDDLLYDKNWLEKLLLSYCKTTNAIHCHRAHMMNFEKGVVLPYRQWTQNIKQNKTLYNTFQTGVGGVLYPPHSLYKDVLDEEKFMRLCPQADDIWFWAMAVKNNTPIKVVENNITKLNYVDGTQKTALWHSNVIEGQNDIQLQNVLKEYPEILDKLDKTISPTQPKNIEQPHKAVVLSAHVQSEPLIAPQLKKYVLSYNLFGFLPLFTYRRRGGKEVWKILSIPFWKVRKVENGTIKKYYFLNLPLLKISDM
ncbi:MAG: glycosyltransferase [Alphaproteobacteria bacterium]|nr:glycosyltransferase [Alphaproteobacteria bacterium]